jgi:hypothetical protein
MVDGGHDVISASVFLGHVRADLVRCPERSGGDGDGADVDRIRRQPRLGHRGRIPGVRDGRELPGILTLEAISLVTAVGMSLLSRQSFDFATLRRRDQALAEDRDVVGGAIMPADSIDPAPVR